MTVLIANTCCALSLALLLQCAAVDSGAKVGATPQQTIAGTPSRGTLIGFLNRKGGKARQSVAQQRWTTGVADFLKRFQLCELFVSVVQMFVQIQWDVTEWGVGMVTR